MTAEVVKMADSNLQLSSRLQLALCIKAVTHDQVIKAGEGITGCRHVLSISHKSTQACMSSSMAGRD